MLHVINISIIFALGSAATVMAPSTRAASFADRAGVATSVQELVITPHIEEEEYCRDRNGIDQLRLTLGFTYMNRGARPLIVPILTRLSEVRIKADEQILMQFRHKLRDLEGISTTIYTTEAPSPTLFFVLSQGQSRVGIQQLIILRIAPRGTRRKRGILSPGEYRLEVDLNLGARLSNDPAVSSDQWKGVGTLVLGKTAAVPMQLKIAEPRDANCVTPRSIL
jgi:hypothetical protein